MSSTVTAGRSGDTEKVSVSITRADLRVLRRRARRLYRGNLSAVIAEAALRMREEEGRESVVNWLGDAGRAAPEESASIRAEWQVEVPPRKPPTRRVRK